MQKKKRQLILGAGAATVSSALPLSALLASKNAQADTPARTLVATYFPGWCNPMDASQRWIHGQNPWGIWPMLHHRMGEEQFADRFPIEGPWKSDGTGGYDERQPEYMEAAVEHASAYGVDVFSINWYRDAFLNYAVDNLKRDPAVATNDGYKISNYSKIKWFLQWSNNSNSQPSTDNRAYFYEGMRLAAHHMKGQPQYWTIDNQPVFAIFDTTQIDRIIVSEGGTANTTARNLFLQNCHNIVDNVLNDMPDGGISLVDNKAVVSTRHTSFQSSMYLVLQSADPGGWFALKSNQPVPSVNGMFTYNIRGGNFAGPNTYRKATSFDEITQAAQAQYELLIPAMSAYPNQGYSWWPTLMSGYDDRPWYNDGDARIQQCTPTLGQFEAHCKQVNNVHNSHADVTCGITFIYAWNEWGEGGWIAPSGPVDHAFDKLIALKKFLKNAPPTTA